MIFFYWTVSKKHCIVCRFSNAESCQDSETDLQDMWRNVNRAHSVIQVIPADVQCEQNPSDPLSVCHMCWVVFTHSWCAWQPKDAGRREMEKQRAEVHVEWDEVKKTENERGEKKRRIRLAPSWQRDIHTQRGEREREVERAWQRITLCSTSLWCQLL